SEERRVGKECRYMWLASVLKKKSVLMGLMAAQSVNVWLTAVIGLLFAAGVGTVNGIITVYFKINSLVTTLGTYSIFLGVAYAISNTAFFHAGGGIRGRNVTGVQTCALPI